MLCECVYVYNCRLEHTQDYLCSSIYLGHLIDLTYLQGQLVDIGFARGCNNSYPNYQYRENPELF